MAACKKLAFPLHSHLPTRHQLQHFPCSLRSRFPRLSTLHVILEGGENEIRQKDTLKAYGCSCGDNRITEDISNKVIEGNIDKTFRTSSPDTDEHMTAIETTSAASNSLELGLLLENLNEIENIVCNTDLLRLEREILVHMQRLGALKLFHACLSSTISTSATIEHRDCLTECLDARPNNEIIVHSGRKEQRKFRRARASEKARKAATAPSSSSKRITKVRVPSFLFPSSSSGAIDSSEAAKKRVVIARNEAEMSRGVKEVAELERVRIQLEEKTGQATSYAKWAEAAGIDQKTLRQRLQFGWYCRDKLIRSTRSLVIYLAKNYRGKGIAFDDLLQAGNVGVLKGAERFDNERGYRFSTYVQYWIKKSILTLVERHSRGIQIPVRLEKVISQVKNARRTMSRRNGRYIQDDEIAKFTGLSVDKVRLASKCARAVGSLDEEIGVGWGIKFMEVTPDTSTIPADEVITRQHLKKYILELLEDLHPNEKQVLVHRYGLQDGKCKSLGEIGRLFHVTKEWIRKIEKGALAKIRTEDIQCELKHYTHL
ncbi:hypothetical protein J5N97_019363 [Dioscorea zingiberensis]|uniref:Sigma factor n=1 Tax=Dioscorea zingiberensis TaxID=325984 RepID=A0A9D5HCE5_9LILI|nr:hypothetical protein J5N97_019363 [Dioscorea zingiberensis]